MSLSCAATCSCLPSALLCYLTVSTMPTRGSQWTLMEGHTGAGGVSGRAVLQTWAIQRSAPVTPTSSVHIHSKDTPSVTDACPPPSPYSGILDRACTERRSWGRSAHPPSFLFLQEGAHLEGRWAETCLPRGTGLLEASWQLHLPPLG